MTSFDPVAGSLLGTALGDALGLPLEGASPAWVARHLPLEHRMTPWGTGLPSDDTDHSRMLLQSLAIDPEAGPAFERAFAWHLRWWFASLPAGIGLGTARACIKLWLGGRTGVRSAGNGPAMRAAILGAFRQDADWLERAVRTSTRLTHTDPRALDGALLVARLAAVATSEKLVAAHVEIALEGLGDALAVRVRAVLDGLAAGRPAEELVDPNGVTGFVLDTVPAVVAVVLTHPDDLRSALTLAIRLGGDTDTVGAIVGGVVGAHVGHGGLPSDWLEGYGDLAWTTERLEALARATVEGRSTPRVLPLGLFRHLFVLPLAIGHLVHRTLGGWLLRIPSRARA